MKQLIVNKLLSGRFLLTVACAVVFAYIAAKQIIPPEATVTILASVFTSYFGRNDRPKAEEPAKP